MDKKIEIFSKKLSHIKKILYYSIVRNLYDEIINIKMMTKEKFEFTEYFYNDVAQIEKDNKYNVFYNLNNTYKFTAFEKWFNCIGMLYNNVIIGKVEKASFELSLSKKIIMMK